MCAGSRIYYVNKDNQNRGLYGCDPPWGYVRTGCITYTGSCCRISPQLRRMAMIVPLRPSRHLPLSRTFPYTA
ncbi:hypothetical protein CGCA056_v000353 [Colletotrichum aenigma]|uniref:uncharacterized protein n=1 Tax=Colletotrichum aenigma TaxID=1215731 RepID=UPI00187284A5|nr:uncharacterized protein CGCA056_v000353 [Colletotrichum aenigma]KAF5527012.1 hypothetical protein CGCA056_v000353 [Colletotrichum aenigma]